MSADNIRVIVRFRPHNKVEKKAGDKKLDKSKSLEIMNKELMCVAGKNIAYDAVLNNKTTQDDAFERIAQASCDDLLIGFNSTIFVYGQTGSGKTYTMYGDESSNEVEGMGVIPRAVSYIFEHLENDKKSSGDSKLMEFEMKVSFVEIYNENLKDLLATGKNPPPLKIRMNADKVTYVDNLSFIKVNHVGEVLKLIVIAGKNRQTGRTNMNAVSSRGHLVMQLKLWQKRRDGNSVVTLSGVSNFADLAGSERNKKTGATGQRMKEAQNINLSLTVLGRVINALSSAKKGKLAPYRESKLTHILKSSLGGNCKTTLVVTGSTHSYNREETIGTLQFGQRCKMIKTKAKVNRLYTENELLARVHELEAENAELRALNGVSKKNFKDQKLSRRTTHGGDNSDEVWALKEELDETKFMYNSEKNKVGHAEKKLGFDLNKLQSENEVLNQKIEELRKIVEAIDKGHDGRESLLASLKGSDIFNNQVSGLLLRSKGKVKKKQKKEKRRKKFWVWMDPESGEGYKKYHQGLSTYLDEFQPNQEENVKINDQIYLMCRAGKNRGFAEEIKTKIVLDLKRVTEEEFKKLNEKY